MDKDKAKLVLINFQIDNWSKDGEIKLINKKIMPFISNLASIKNDAIVKSSLENGSKFILVNGIPYSANDILSMVKEGLAQSIVKVMFEKEKLCMEDLILEIEEERATKNTETGEVRIINCIDENKVNTTEDMIKKVLESTNEILMVDVTSSNNVEEYITNGGGEAIEDFLTTLIEGAKDNESRRLIEAFEALDGAWDIVDALNKRVDEYLENN